MEEIKSSSRCFTANNRRDQNLLQSTGVVCGVCAWRSKGSNGDGAQIDLLIDRDDRVINLCEMKFCEGPFAVDREYDERLRERRATFLRQTGTRKAVKNLRIRHKRLFQNCKAKRHFRNGTETLAIR